MTVLAVGLVHRPAGTPTVDWQWARALIVRHARDRNLQLLDVLDTRGRSHDGYLDEHDGHDDHDSPDPLARRLGHAVRVAQAAGAAVLLSDGLGNDLARALDDLAVTHHLHHERMPGHLRSPGPSPAPPPAPQGRSVLSPGPL